MNTFNKIASETPGFGKEIDPHVFQGGIPVGAAANVANKLMAESIPAGGTLASGLGKFLVGSGKALDAMQHPGRTLKKYGIKMLLNAGKQEAPLAAKAVQEAPSVAEALPKAAEELGPKLEAFFGRSKTAPAAPPQAPAVDRIAQAREIGKMAEKTRLNAPQPASAPPALSEVPPLQDLSTAAPRPALRGDPGQFSLSELMAEEGQAVNPWLVQALQMASKVKK